MAKTIVDDGLRRAFSTTDERPVAQVDEDADAFGPTMAAMPVAKLLPTEGAPATGGASFLPEGQEPEILPAPPNLGRRPRCRQVMFSLADLRENYLAELAKRGGKNGE